MQSDLFERLGDFFLLKIIKIVATSFAVLTGVSGTASAVSYMESVQGDLDSNSPISLALSNGLNTVSGTAGSSLAIGGLFTFDFDRLNFLAGPDAVINSVFITINGVRTTGAVYSARGSLRLSSIFTGESERLTFDVVENSPGATTNGTPIDTPTKFALDHDEVFGKAIRRGTPLDFRLSLDSSFSSNIHRGGSLEYDYLVEIDATIPPLTTVPIPAALPLLLGGIGMLGLVGRRRNRTTA